MTVLVELDPQCERNRLCVRFPFSKINVEKVRQVPGRTYLKSGKHWHVPKDLEACRQLRNVFGDELEVGPLCKAWATGEVRLETKLGSIASASTAQLERLPRVLPKLYEAIHLGPLGKHMTPEERIEGMKGPASYQAADVEFLVHAPAPLNANDQGTGKTIEWIAAVWEAGLEEGDHLIVCPRAAVDGTWEPELRKWQEEAADRVGIFACVDNRDARQETLDEWQACTKPVRWVVVNPAMVQYRKDPNRDEQRQYIAHWTAWVRDTYGRPPTPEERQKILSKAMDLFPLSPLTLAVKGKRKEQEACYCKAHKGPHEHYTMPYPELVETKWTTINIDEAHKGAVRNHKSLTAKSLKACEIVEGGKVCAMSGTPMKRFGGNDLWGILHFLQPKQFSSFWRFAESYYEITDNGYGKKVGKLRTEKEEALFKALTPYIIRRTKKEVAPWLPDKLYVEVPVTMTARQAKQYSSMEDDAYTQIGNNEVMSKGVLDTIVKLKQFANAHCKLTNGEITPIDSPKVDAMLQKMEEIGIFEDHTGSKHLVFSQSKRMVKFISEKLTARGLRHAVLSGETKAADRKRMMQQFQFGDLPVMVVVTTAGGVSLTLDAADTVHLIDEMWAPDDDAQAEDRAHRVSRIHQVTVYIYRSIGTIDEDIAITKLEKQETHSLILDVRRKMAARHGKDSS